MPRARTSESEDVVVVKKPRAPRTRAASVDGEPKPAPRKRAPRKTTPKAAPKVEAVIEQVSEEPVVVSQRKAPTPLAADRKRSVRSNILFSIVATFCVLLVGAGVVVGLFDHGPIDVLSVVTTRNEKIARGEVRDENGQVVTTIVPTQTDMRPNGGLTFATPTPAASTTPVAPVATSSATSSISTSTSTVPTATTSKSVASTTAKSPLP